MANLWKQIITCGVKEVAPRVLEITGSTETVDRYGDVVRVSGWDLENYRKNPVFMWSHDYSQPPIGKAVKVWADRAEKKLKFHIEFADKDTYPFADTVYRLYKGGFIKATSVGFKPLDWEGKTAEDDYPKQSGNIFTKQELWELSACAIPANPDALAMAIKSGVIKDFEIKDIAVTGADSTGNLLVFNKEVLAEIQNKLASETLTKKPTQAEISDEMDYLIALIDEAGLSDEVKPKAQELLKRLQGGDTPVNIEPVTPVTNVTQPIITLTDEQLAQISQQLTDYLHSELRTIKCQIK